MIEDQNPVQILHEMLATPLKVWRGKPWLYYTWMFPSHCYSYLLDTGSHFSTWRSRFHLLLKLCPQYWQSKVTLSLLWASWICLFKLSILVKLDPQVSHLFVWTAPAKLTTFGFCFLWTVFSCLFLWALRVNFFPQTLHSKDLWSEWIWFIWASRYLLTENSFSQCLHLNGWPALSLLSSSSSSSDASSSELFSDSLQLTHASSSLYWCSESSSISISWISRRCLFKVHFRLNSVSHTSHFQFEVCSFRCQWLRFCSFENILPQNSQTLSQNFLSIAVCIWWTQNLHCMWIILWYLKWFSTFERQVEQVFLIPAKCISLTEWRLGSLTSSKLW